MTVGRRQFGLMAVHFKLVIPGRRSGEGKSARNVLNRKSRFGGRTMRSIQKLLAQLRKSETGFTLVELLVVVGIIVALAAVIIPNVAKFTSKGTEGANAAEQETVQTAFDTLMADAGLGAIDAPAALSLALNDFETGGFPKDGGASIMVDIGGVATAVDAHDYMRGGDIANPTVNFYCWGADGLVSQFATAAACP